MRRLLLCAILLAAIAGLYAASPFRAAWVLREAIREGDRATIERKVEWDSVRASLKASLAQHTQLLQEGTAAGAEIRPTVWQRVKSAMGATMLDRFIETYVTPDGLPKLYSYRKLWNEKVKGAPDEGQLTLAERFVRLSARVKRIGFRSLGRVEIEVADRNVPERRYVSQMELAGIEWKLVSVRVVTAEDPGNLLAER